MYTEITNIIYACYQNHCSGQFISFLSFSPTIVSEKFIGNDSEILWVNTTTEYFISVHVFALDNGSPRRGDYVIFNVSYSATCQTSAQVAVGEKDGEVNLIAPGMSVSTYSTCSFLVVLLVVIDDRRIDFFEPTSCPSRSAVI